MSNKISGKKSFSVREGKVASQVSLDIKNDELIKKLEVCIANKNNNTLGDLITELVKCRVLIPAIKAQNNKPVPQLMKTGQGDTFLGIYTDISQVPQDQKQNAFLNMPYLVANKFAINPTDSLKGIVINPFTHNFILMKPLLEQIDVVEANKKLADPDPVKAKEAALSNLGNVETDENGNKVLKMNMKQYNQFERTEFEVGFLPRKLFADPSSFLDKLSADKENYLDELFEESYQQKRMYPFLPEDFSIMPLSISEDFTIIRIDMPDKDITFGNAYRLYITNNTTKNEVRYFRIICGKEANQVILEEIKADRAILNLGDAPVEGTELAKISELCGYTYE